MSNQSPEQHARDKIDRLLQAGGWHVCNFGEQNITLPCAIREFPLKSGHGHADYLLYLQGKAVGVVEAKKVGYTLKGVEVQSARYTAGLPDDLPAWERPLPFSYESTGTETQFTNNLDHEPRSRRVFAFYKPEGLAKLLEFTETNKVDEANPNYIDRGRTFLERMTKAKATNKDQALRQAASQAFYNTPPFNMRDLKARASQAQLRADFEAYLDGFSPGLYTGLHFAVKWEDGKGVLANSPEARIQRRPAWGKQWLRPQVKG